MCCLLIDLVMLIDSCHSMIVRFASPTTRGFSHCFFLSLVSSLHGERKPLGPGYREKVTKLNICEIKVGSLAITQTWLY